MNRRELLREVVAKYVVQPILAEVDEDFSYYGNTIELQLGEETVGIDVPDPERDDADAMARGTVVTMRENSMQADMVDHALRLLATAQAIQAHCNTAMAEATEIAQAAAEQAEAERVAAAAAREEVLADRKERLLNEFVDSKGKVRLRGYKRWRPVTVQVAQDGLDNWEPVFYYVNERHGWREPWMGGHRVRSFQVKMGSRYQTVWDDGQDDLSEWERTDKAAPPAYDGNSERQ